MQDQHEFQVNTAFDTALPPGALNDPIPPAPSTELVGDLAAVAVVSFCEAPKILDLSEPADRAGLLTSFEVPDYSAMAEIALPPLVGEMTQATGLPAQIEQPQASVIPA